MFPWKVGLLGNFEIFPSEASSLAYQTHAWRRSGGRAKLGEVERVPALTNSFGDDRTFLRCEKPFPALTADAAREVRVTDAVSFVDF